MILHIIRHAKTHRDSLTGKDYDRTLKARGIRQAAALGLHLAGLEKERPELVISSPYIRAAQTSNALCDALHLKPMIDDRLGADGRVGAVLEAISDHAHKGARVAVVGHNPIVSRLVDVVLKGPSAPHHASLRTGECVTLKVDPDSIEGSGKTIRVFREELKH